MSNRIAVPRARQLQEETKKKKQKKKEKRQGKGEKVVKNTHFTEYTINELILCVTPMTPNHIINISSQLDTVITVDNQSSKG